MLLKPLSLDKNINASIPFWAWPNLLSLDAVLVAIIWQWFFAKSFALQVVWQQELILALTVWLIYVLDRLFDGLKLDLGKEHSLRHEFYYKHYIEFAILAFFIFCADVYLVFTSLEMATIILGLVVFAFVLLYGTGLHLWGYARAYKEIYIGVLFSIGVNLVFLKDLNLNLIIAIILFAILASLNCLLISSWEQNSDRAQNYQSDILKPKHFGKAITDTIIAFMLISLGVFIISLNQIYFAIFLSFILLFILNSQKELLSNLKLRILVDLALLSPLLVVFF